jgi:NF-kappa-B inhibitor-like protein 1
MNFFSDQYENDERESYDDWADRLRREYHLKNRNYGHRHSSNKREATSESQSHDKNDSKECLEDIRKKLRKKYEENQKRDRANRILMKSKNYLKNIIALQSGTGGIKCNDVPWPYSVDVVEIKNVMFHDVLTDDHKYKKRLREEQIRWHPDKFLQKHGKRLCECDRNRIMEKVKEISQELNRLSDLL